MRWNLFFLTSAAAAIFLTGCASVPSDVEHGPHNTVAYDVLVEASPPGGKIEANGQVLGVTPLHLKIFGDPDGTFHDFGSDFYIIRALPITTNQFVQTRYFGTGHLFGPEDHIPKQIYFEMSQPPSANPPGAYVPYARPPIYYGPEFYGPSFRFYLSPGPRWRRDRW